MCAHQGSGTKATVRAERAVPWQTIPRDVTGFRQGQQILQSWKDPAAGPLFVAWWGWFNLRSDSMVRDHWLWVQGPGIGADGPRCRWGILMTSLVQRALTQLFWGLSWDKDSPMMFTGKTPQNTENDWVWKGYVEVTFSNQQLRQGLLEPATMNKVFPRMCKEGNSTGSLGNLCLCSVTHLVTEAAICISVLLPCSFSCPWASLAHHSLSFSSYVGSPSPGAQPVHLIDSLNISLHFFFFLLNVFKLSFQSYLKFLSSLK